MPCKLVQGAKFPAITLNLIDGRTIHIPDQMPDRYLAILFYRGKW